MPNATMWYVMLRTEREIRDLKGKKRGQLNAISYEGHCTVVVELEQQQLLVAVELVDSLSVNGEIAEYVVLERKKRDSRSIE